MLTLISCIGVAVGLIVGVVFLNVCACVFSLTKASPVDKAARAENPERRSVFLSFVMVLKLMK